MQTLTSPRYDGTLEQAIAEYSTYDGSRLHLNRDAFELQSLLDPSEICVTQAAVVQGVPDVGDHVEAIGIGRRWKIRRIASGYPGRMTISATRRPGNRS